MSDPSKDLSKSIKPAVDNSGFSCRILSDCDADINWASEKLKNGQTIAIPTETVYGLAANALNTDACRQIFKIKGRPLLDPLIVHVESLSVAHELAELNSSAEKLAETFWPGPLTIILKKRSHIPSIVTANLNTVAIRSPKHPAARKLLKASNLALAAPSANPFAYVSPTRASHVIESLGNKIPGIIDGGPCEIGLESTIIDLSKEETPSLLRPGSISAEEIEAVLGKKLSIYKKNKDEQIKAPGLLDKHYSPKTNLYLKEKEEIEKQNPTEKQAFIFLFRPETAQSERHYWLSETKDLKAAAASLFHLLRKLDKEELDEIWIETPPKEGIGIALLDRLNRASI